MLKAWLAKLHPIAEQRHNQRHAPLWWRWLWAPFRAVYWVALMLRQLALKTGLLSVYKPPVPVLSIGNLTIGGTGKTPIVTAIARYFSEAGYRVVVLSRGYGASNPQSYARATRSEYGDEAYCTQQDAPKAIVIVGKNRRLTARRSVEDYNPHLLVLDDGHQYQRLHRDENWLLVDSEIGFGNGLMLPGGPLRETYHALRRATALLLTRAVEGQRLEELETIDPKACKHMVAEPFLVPFTPACLTQWEGDAVQPPEWLQDRPVLLVSALARPKQLEAMLTRQGADLLHHWAFFDHHVYEADDFNEVAERLTEHPNAVIVTTGKDVVKWRDVCPQPLRDKVWVLQVKPELPSALLQRVRRLLPDRPYEEPVETPNDPTRREEDLMDTSPVA